MEMEACQHHSAQVVVLIQRTVTPAYRVVAGSPVRAAIQRGGQLACPRWLTMPRRAHRSAPAADSPVSDFSFTY